MRWNQNNFTEGIWRIPDTENGTPQNVTLSPEALEILTVRKEDAEGAFVFPGDGQRRHLVELKMGWQPIFDRDELAQLISRFAAHLGKLASDTGRKRCDHRQELEPQEPSIHRDLRPA